MSRSLICKKVAARARTIQTAPVLFTPTAALLFVVRKPCSYSYPRRTGRGPVIGAASGTVCAQSESLQCD